MKRLSPATLTVGMLGVVGLLVTLYVGKKLLATDVLPPGDPIINLPMALTDLEPGTRITEAHIGLGRTRQSAVTRDVVQTNRVLVGRVVKNAIPAAQPISTNDLYPPGKGVPLELEPGMVAVTVPMQASTAAEPGQYVDIHFTPSADPDAGRTGGQILTLFKGVKILQMNGVSRGTAAAGSGDGQVTLELSPQQANIVLLAKDRGTLNMVYNPRGKGTGVVAVGDENRATLYQILGYQPEPEVAPFMTEVFPGPGRQVHRFQNGVLNADQAVDRVSTPSPAANQ